ncbi:NAD(P)-dependent oxidoreductase [Actinomadura rupiterrae]|uniref:NAD(P)-dependent oxidoreductase n=1 Tax=Actinomadura rupiterrae TaxID=559627 RepID=UPI0020A26147|nr:NAD(P)-binding domain-containing protein [Actinomadura rupiterrae]MCP2336168.1 3-hydroxyisobutyrate dehydrogenase-like beta-hydroxyacid dehydrogenase [Actinomadura rupiterrae]
MSVTVIGLGAMGARMAEVFLEKGHDVTVWNRTAGKAENLVAKGATLAPTAADALAANELVVLSQTHYQAMYDSLEGAEHALDGRVLVNLSSGSPDELREAAKWAGAHGARLLPGGIMTPVPGIGTPAAETYIAGPEDVLERHRATLGAITDTSYVGADPGLAMLYYNAGFYLFAATMAAFMQATALVASAGVSPREYGAVAAPLVRSLGEDGPMGFVKICAEHMATGTYPGAADTVLMEAISVGHVVEAARAAGIDASGPAALKALFDRAVDAGYRDEGLGAIYEVIRKPSA